MDAHTFLESCDALIDGGRRPSQVLEEAAELLADPQRWAQGATARDARGRRVHPSSPYAVCWCAEGAVARLANRHGVLPPSLMKTLDRAAEDGLTVFSVAEVNDYGAHEDVLLLLKVARMLAREQERGDT